MVIKSRVHPHFFRSVRHLPAREPLEVAPLTARSNHSEANRPEQPVKPDNNHIQCTKDTPLDLLA